MVLLSVYRPARLRQGGHACDDCKADELDSKLANSNAVQLPPGPRGPGVSPGADSSHAVGVLRLPIGLMVGSMANESTGTGVAELDRALDGLYWGDNVVWAVSYTHLTLPTICSV